MIVEGELRDATAGIGVTDQIRIPVIDIRRCPPGRIYGREDLSACVVSIRRRVAVEVLYGDVSSRGIIRGATHAANRIGFTQLVPAFIVGKRSAASEHVDRRDDVARRVVLVSNDATQTVSNDLLACVDIVCQFDPFPRRIGQRNQTAIAVVFRLERTAPERVVNFEQVVCMVIAERRPVAQLIGELDQVATEVVRVGERASRWISDRRDSAQLVAQESNGLAAAGHDPTR